MLNTRLSLYGSRGYYKHGKVLNFAKYFSKALKRFEILLKTEKSRIGFEISASAEIFSIMLIRARVITSCCRVTSPEWRQRHFSVATACASLS